MSEIKIYGDICDFSWFEEDVSLTSINNQLESINKTEDLLVRINTFGGSVDAGFAIYNAIRRFGKENNIKITTRQDGYCASIGTVIFLAGDTRIGNKWAEPFVHNAWSMAVGDSGEMQKVAADLEMCNDKIAKFYSERTNMSYEQARDYMTNETFIPANKCLEFGFFTEIEDLDSIYMMYNHNKKTVIKNNLNMDKKEIDEMLEAKNQSLIRQIFDGLKSIFPSKKALMLTDANGQQVDFPDTPDGTMPQVGDTVTGVTDKEILMADGSTIVVVGGKVSEIKPKEDESEVDVELEALKAENAQLKEQLATAQAKAVDGETYKAEATEYGQVKAQMSKIKSQMDAEQKQDSKKEEQKKESDEKKKFEFKGAKK